MRDRNGVEISKEDRVIVCISDTPSTLVEGIVSYVTANKINYRVASTTTEVWTAPQIGDVKECRANHRVRILR